MTKLFLVRHGQSQWNLENRFTGWKNVDITEQGKQEAKNAGEILKNETIDVAFTSELIRAQHTLEIILNEFENKNEIRITKHLALNERAYGDLEGLNKAETAEKFGKEQVHIWRRSFDVPPPNGESLKDTYNRVIPYFETHIKPLLAQGKKCTYRRSRKQPPSLDYVLRKPHSFGNFRTRNCHRRPRCIWL